MPRDYHPPADQSASFADFLALWDDAREDVTGEEAQSKTRREDSITTLGLGWLGTMLLSGGSKS